MTKTKLFDLSNNGSLVPMKPSVRRDDRVVERADLKSDAKKSDDGSNRSFSDRFFKGD